MIVYRVLAGETAMLYSPVGLRLLDEFTGKQPLGSVRAFLDRRLAPGVWQETGLAAVTTPGGVITYPGLERRHETAGLPARRYRIRVEADFYRPFYRRIDDGVEFDAFPYNDANPPSVINAMPRDELLVPSSAYPFPTHVRVLRGAVVDASGRGVPDAVVSQGGLERVLTDERGAFALPLRWAIDGAPLPIDATDLHPPPRAGMKLVTLPLDLGKNHEITII